MKVQTAPLGHFSPQFLASSTLQKKQKHPTATSLFYRALSHARVHKVLSFVLKEERAQVKDTHTHITKRQYHSLHEQKIQTEITQETWILMCLDIQDYVSIILTALCNSFFFFEYVHVLKYINYLGQSFVLSPHI